MCEEFPRRSRLGVKEFDRRVTRVITPGTLIDEPFLNPYENNFLLAIGTPSGTSSQEGNQSDATKLIGLAWIDVSTGEFFSKPSTYDDLRDELARLGPREIVLDKRLESTMPYPLSQALAEEINVVSYISPLGKHNVRDVEGRSAELDILDRAVTEDQTLPQSRFNEAEGSSDDLTSSETHELPYTPQETTAIDLLTTFLHANLLEHMPALSSPKREGAEGRMQIDSHTIKALEIREGIREGGTRGSLLSVIKRTATGGGTRLLTRWLCMLVRLSPPSSARLTQKSRLSEYLAR